MPNQNLLNVQSKSVPILPKGASVPYDTLPEAAISSDPELDILGFTLDEFIDSFDPTEDSSDDDEDYDEEDYGDVVADI